jgi:uncharacterized membrane protein
MTGVSAWLILGIIAALFFGMYLYAISHNLIEDAKEMRRLKKKREKEEKILEERIRKNELRAEKYRLIEKRRQEIAREFEWLERMNEKIRKKTSEA